jgi:hypothetical protein
MPEYGIDFAVISAKSPALDGRKRVALEHGGAPPAAYKFLPMRDHADRITCF